MLGLLTTCLLIAGLWLVWLTIALLALRHQLKQQHAAMSDMGQRMALLQDAGTTVKRPPLLMRD